MTDVERMFCMSRLYAKLDNVHTLLSLSWSTLLQHTFTRTAVLSWLATMLLGNAARTKMRAQRKSTSNDGFLLNIAAIMLQVIRTQHWYNPNTDCSRINPFYAFGHARMDLKDQTKICATPIQINKWIQNNNKYSISKAAAGCTAGGSSDAVSSCSMPTSSPSGTTQTDNLIDQDTTNGNVDTLVYRLPVCKSYIQRMLLYWRWRSI